MLGNVRRSESAPPGGATVAKGCTIPCNLGGVERRIRRRAFKKALGPQLPVLGAGVLFLLAAPVLIALANWQVALVAVLFFLLGTTVVAARVLIGTADEVRYSVPVELSRILDEQAGQIHPGRLDALRAEAERLTYDVEAYSRRVGQFLQGVRETTGEAWRCPCRKRRLPIPLPLPF
jgi:hypothetical protein